MPKGVSSIYQGVNSRPSTGSTRHTEQPLRTDTRPKRRFTLTPGARIAAKQRLFDQAARSGESRGGNERVTGSGGYQGGLPGLGKRR